MRRMEGHAHHDVGRMMMWHIHDDLGCVTCNSKHRMEWHVS